MKWSVGEEAAVVPVKCCGSNTAECWRWWRIMCWQQCASQMEAVLCTVVRNLEFSFHSLLPMLTIWGVFVYVFQRTCTLNTMKATYSVLLEHWWCFCVSLNQMSPIQINSKCSLWCSLVYIFLFWLTWFVWDKKLPSSGFCGCYASFFIVLYFKRSEAQTNNWLKKNQSAETSLKFMLRISPPVRGNTDSQIRMALELWLIFSFLF